MMKNARNIAKKYGSKVALVAAPAVLLVKDAMAEIDTTAVQTGITAAVGKGETVGGYVIVGVATLVVIGLIIGIVKKL